MFRLYYDICRLCGADTIVKLLSSPYNCASDLKQFQNMFEAAFPANHYVGTILHRD